MNSIKKSYHLPFVITLSFALGGLSCSRDATPRNPQDASFVVDQPVTLVKSEQSVGSSSMSVPVKNAMTFSACIKDRAKLAPVISQQFAIHSETGTINVTTNAEGCLSWSEEIPFNYLQDETYVESTHTIEGLGPFLGSRDVNLALDPWQTGGDAMVDMRQNPNIQKLVSGKTVGEALQAAIVSGVSKPSRVRVNSIATESDDIRSSGSSATINLRVNLAPSLTRTNLAGNLVNEQIMHGNFSIALTLIERVQSGTQNPADDQLLILAQNSASGSLDQTGHLNVSAPLVLQRMPNPSSIIELAFRLTPTDSPDSLASEEGLTRIGTIAGLRGQNSLTVTRPDISSYLQQAERDTELFQTLGSAKNPMGTSSTSPACSDGSSELGFYLSQVAVQWTGVKDRTPNEQVPSSVIASVMVCLNNSIDRSALANRVFEVGFDNESTSQVTTDNSGCFRWNEPVAFDYFAPERWILKNMHITSDSAPVQNVNRSFPLYLDPWQNDQNFFWDCRKGALPTFQAKPAQIEMTDFT